MQTSIEWLIEQLVEMDKQLDGRRKNEDATILKINPTKIFEQAKEMHKQEIIDELIGFQVFLNNKGLITSHDWHWEALAKKYIKSFKKK
jgi:hypothetical protein